MARSIKISSKEEKLFLGHILVKPMVLYLPQLYTCNVRAATTLLLSVN
jgi:hypothetical protein